MTIIITFFSLLSSASAGLTQPPQRVDGTVGWVLNLTEEAQVSSECVTGEVGHSSAPLYECLPFDYQGTTYYSKVSCNDTTLLSGYWATEGCTSSPVSVVSYAVGVCQTLPNTRGLSGVFSCNDTAYTVTEWSFSPPAPSAPKCNPGLASATSLAVSCEVDASAIDLVSFEVAGPSLRPFLSYTAIVTGSNTVTATIPGLRANSTYTVFARALRRGQSQGNPDAWSDVGLGSSCETSDTGSAPLPTVARRKKTTRWLEVYRVASGAQLGDFLDEHNGADLTGAGTSYLSFLLAAPNTPLTRYCVEIEDVTLRGVVTASPTGKPQESPYADYLSCNAGHCLCMHQIDRSLARLPATMFARMCNGTEYADPSTSNSCRCPRWSTWQSERHVGRAMVPSPFMAYNSLSQLPLQIPADYPLPWRQSPMGHYYSFPSKGRCAPGDAVGEHGCTWQVSPLSHTLFSDDLWKVGLNVTPAEPIPFVQGIHNVAVLGTAVAGMPVDVPTCGTEPISRIVV